MHVTRHSLAAGCLAFALLLPLGCDSSGPAEPTSGALEISVSTTSESIDIDPDGYTLSMDGGPAQSVGVSGTITFGTVPNGTHYVWLLGLASNCRVNGSNPRRVDFTAGRPLAPVAIEVLCTSAVNSGAGAWDY